MTKPQNDDDICPLCGRPLRPGPSVERHHVIPKSRGGGNTVRLHAVCHRMLHKVFNEHDLGSIGADFALLRGHAEMAKFLRWVQKKPADFVDRPRTAGRRPYNKAPR